MATIKILFVIFAVLVVYLQARGIEKREINRYTQTALAQQFLFQATLVSGRNASTCGNTTQYVTPTVCDALDSIEDQFELLSCRVFRNQHGYHTCLGVVEGARNYCRILGPSLPRGPDADLIMCRAINKYLNEDKK